MKEFAPDKAIIPIVKGSREKQINELLGTGFFVCASGELHVLTAKHVFQDSPLDKGEHYAYVFNTGTRIQVWSIPKYSISKNFDIAIFKPQQFESAIPLQFAECQPSLNDDIICYEYSGTRIERTRPDHTHVAFEPMAHKGNIMRSYVSDYPETKPTPSMIVSFPAMQGASGAPIICAFKREFFYVAGMVVANVERHLMPAQVVRIDDADGAEETSYFLPTAKAIDASVIRSVITELGLDLECVKPNQIRQWASKLARRLGWGLGGQR